MKAGLFLAAWFTCSVVLVGGWIVWAEFRRTMRRKASFGPVLAGLVKPTGYDDYRPCACPICTGPDAA